ncbi:MAG TPA: hypothetical protein VMJ32_02610 [Pirellulales bacterium]|nr:hypothetical protein [Pirellulales bacterium]
MVWEAFGHPSDANGFGEGDAYSPIGFLLAFLTTQVAAFLVAVQGDDGEKVLLPSLLLILFALLFVLPPILWYVQKTKAGNLPQPHEFNAGSVYFGRWALRLTLTLIISCPVLGYLQLLPGQDKRVEFKAASVEFLPPIKTQSFSTLQAHNNKQVNQLLRSYVKGLNPSSDQDVLLVEQDGNFEEDYHSFSFWTAFGQPVRTMGGKAFLIRHASAYQSSEIPTYDDLRFLPDEPEPPSKEVIELSKPNKGDFIVLILIVQKRTDVSKYEFPSNPSNYNLVMRVHK